MTAACKTSSVLLTDQRHTASSAKIIDVMYEAVAAAALSPSTHGTPNA